MSQIILITGANRGLGKGLVEKYLAQPNNFVVAAVRDPAGATAKTLDSLTKGSGSQLLLVKIDSLSASDPAAAVKTIEAAGIDHLDVVLANAGISDDWSQVATVPVDVFQRHMDTNAYGALHLIQAVFPLLSKSKAPKFVAIGSALGSIGGMEQRSVFPCAAYGPSKAVVHWLVRKLHFENENFISFTVDPGFIQTDMGYAGAKRFGIDKPPTTVEDCVNGISGLIDKSTREQSGRNLVWDGSEFPW